ncbi:nucleotidyl transferase AbiEii/AbiGii toxin family protein [Muricoccus radiodurans]|uniref:nucleotidyl transferase AbiEii/AbiGii toxin family protein n=1 Tax=Muricoccus radiodurans TaxID=2231721 RepID=UPI003CF542A2
MREAVSVRHLPSRTDRVGQYRLGRAIEHLVDGISRSPGNCRFAVRGCWSFAVWLGGLHRTTRGLDLVDLGGAADPMQILRTATGTARGIVFDWDRATTRRSGSGWTERLQVRIPARVEEVSVPVRVVLASRVGGPDHVERLRMHCTGSGGLRPLVACMTREWLAGEKSGLLVTYGPDHSRVRDLFDLWMLQRRFDIDGQALAAAVQAIFVGRDAERMLVRRDTYWEAAFNSLRMSRAQWAAWEEIADSVPRSHPVPSLHHALDEVTDFLVPALESLRDTGAVRGRWRPGSGWVETTSARRAAIPQQPPLPLFAMVAPHARARAVRPAGNLNAGWRA